MIILFEDNHSIAVVKPAGIPVQGDKTGDLSLMDMVKADLKTRHNKPGDVFLGLVHRLDRPVGGIVLFAKTSKGATRLSEQFRLRTVEKTYLAAVEGTPEPKAGAVKHWLSKNKRTNLATYHNTEIPGSKYAELTYKTLETHDGISLVEVHPITGRSHQIRVAMKSLMTPIVGDRKYGAQKNIGREIALFAHKLSFTTAVDDKRITLEAKPNWPFLQP